MLTLEINKETCIKCGKCVRVCPSYILSQNAEKEVEVSHLESCIKCGHCVAICPNDSVIHSNFPATKIHSVNRQTLPTPKQMKDLISIRRSNRTFTSKAVPREYLDQILDAAYRAPTSTNSQELSFTIVTDSEKLYQISKLTMDVFSGLLTVLNPVAPLLKLVSPDTAAMIPSFLALKEKFAGGNDVILRDAKAVILIHSPKEARFGCEDSNLAYQNASLMAESLGVAQFYTGFVCAAAGLDRGKKRLAKYLGIEGKIQAGIALGMPAFQFEKYMDRKPIRATWL